MGTRAVVDVVVGVVVVVIAAGLAEDGFLFCVEVWLRPRNRNKRNVTPSARTRCRGVEGSFRRCSSFGSVCVCVGSRKPDFGPLPREPPADLRDPPPKPPRGLHTKSSSKVLCPLATSIVAAASPIGSEACLGGSSNCGWARPLSGDIGLGSSPPSSSMVLLLVVREVSWEEDDAKRAQPEFSSDNDPASIHRLRLGTLPALCQGRPARDKGEAAPPPPTHPHTHTSCRLRRASCQDPEGAIFDLSLNSKRHAANASGNMTCKIGPRWHLLKMPMKRTSRGGAAATTKSWLVFV